MAVGQVSTTAREAWAAAAIRFQETMVLQEVIACAVCRARMILVMATVREREDYRHCQNRHYRIQRCRVYRAVMGCAVIYSTPRGARIGSKANIFLRCMMVSSTTANSTMANFTTVSFTVIIFTTAISTTSIIFTITIALW